jgi:hypothetical protein
VRPPLRMKKLSLFILFLGFFFRLFSQGTVLTTEGGKPVMLNLDEMRTVRPVTSGSLILYGSALRAIYVSETPAQIAGSGCGQIALVNTTDVGRNTIVGIGVRHIDAIRKTSDGKASIAMNATNIPAMKSVEDFEAIVLRIAVCSTGPGGNGSSAGGDRDSIEAMVYVPTTGRLSLINESGDSISVVINNQTLSVTGDSLSISFGNKVKLPSKSLLDLASELPYYVSDSAALAAGLAPGAPYLLECNNDYNLPSGLFKVVKICGYDCFIVLRFYTNDEEAASSGVPVGREYVLDDDNALGVLYGFIKVLTNDTLSTGGLICNDTLPVYASDALAISGGLAVGDQYETSDENTYGAPAGIGRMVSSSNTLSGTTQVCCDENDNLPFFSNDSAAISAGLLAGEKYYLLKSNTYGWPYGTKKTVQ